MGWFLILLLFAAIVAVVLIAAQRINTRPFNFPYALEKSLFTPAERSFLGVLDQAIGNEYRIFGKVRVADILSVKRGGNKGAFFRISAKHFDFILCRPSDLAPVCVIELNDQSHEKHGRGDRDEFLTNACAAAGLPLLWHPAQRSYQAAEILARLKEVLPSQSASTPVAATTPLTMAEPVTPQEPTLSINETQEPSCPRCSSPMVKRIAKSGDKQGSEFWGCTKFPACRGMISV